MKAFFPAVLVVIAGYASTALAAIPLTSTVSISGGVSASTASLIASVAAGSSTATVNGSVAAAGIDISKFNLATGILVGARIGVSGVTTSNNAQVSGAVRASGNDRTIAAVTSMRGVVSGVGFTSITNAPTAASRSCSGGNCTNSPGNAATTNPGATLAGTAAVAAANLAAYAGPGTVTLARSGTGSSQVTTGSGATRGEAGAFYAFTGGTYSVTYDYLNFAKPSFSGSSVVTNLSLDFGTVVAGTGPVTRTFTLFNIGNINSAGLSLTGISRDLNTPEFSSTVTNVTNLAGGNSVTFSVTFNPTQLGYKIEKFRLALRDYAPESVGGRYYELEINASGTSAAPEPQTWAMMIVGFGMVGAAARRRREHAAARSPGGG